MTNYKSPFLVKLL